MKYGNLKWQLDTSLYLFKSFLKTTCNVHSAVVLALSLAWTAICIQFDIQANLPATLLGPAIIFPITFKLNKIVFSVLTL